MAKKKPQIAFRTTLKGEPGTGDIALIEVPGDVRAVFGKARPAVVATLGTYAFRTTLAVYDGKFYVGVRRSHRDAAKLAPGQSVRVVIALDDAPRTVTPPKELADAMKKDAKARAAWDALSFTHKREHAEAIEGAKKPETRARRVEKTLAMLHVVRLAALLFIASCGGQSTPAAGTLQQVDAPEKPHVGPTSCADGEAPCGKTCCTDGEICCPGGMANSQYCRSASRGDRCPALQ